MQLEFINKPGVLLVAFASVIAVIFCIVSAFRALSGLEYMLVQVIILGIGLMGSYVFGKDSARDGAKLIIKPHARSAFRRLVSLYGSLSRVSIAIEEFRISGEDPNNSNQILTRLEAIVIEQIAMADDALEDWRDIVPDEVADLKSIASKQKGR